VSGGSDRTRLNPRIPVFSPLARRWSRPASRWRIPDLSRRPHAGNWGLVQNRPLRGGAGRGRHAQDGSDSRSPTHSPALGSPSQSRFIAIGDLPPAAQWPARLATKPGGPQEPGILTRNHPRVFGSERQTAKICVCGLMLRARGNLRFSHKKAIFGPLAASDRQDLGGLMVVWIFRSKTRFRHPPPRRAKGKIGLRDYLKTPWRHGIASAAKQSPTLWIDIASSLRSSQ
jgi:hypothetical protein